MKVAAAMVRQRVRGGSTSASGGTVSCQLALLDDYKKMICKSRLLDCALLSQSQPQAEWIYMD